MVTLTICENLAQARGFANADDILAYSDYIRGTCACLSAVRK